VQYWTPTLGGFSARLAASANEGKTSTANPRDVSALFGWAGGGHSLSVSGEKHYDQFGNTVTPKVDEEGLMSAGSVTFGKTMLGFIVERIEKTNRTKPKSYYVSVDHAFFGPNVVAATYGQSNDGALQSDAVQPETKAYSVAYRYTFSKRTMWCTQYAKIDNNSAGTKNFPYYPVPGTAPGSDPRGFAIGMRHLFWAALCGRSCAALAHDRHEVIRQRLQFSAVSRCLLEPSDCLGARPPSFAVAVGRRGIALAPLELLREAIPRPWCAEQRLSGRTRALVAGFGLLQGVRLVDDHRASLRKGPLMLEPVVHVAGVSLRFAGECNHRSADNGSRSQDCVEPSHGASWVMKRGSTLRLRPRRGRDPSITFPT
jgi:hypothetical protein